MTEGEFNAKALSWDFGVGEKGDYIGVEVMLTEGPDSGHSLTWYGSFGDDEHGDPPKSRTEWTKIDLQKMGWDGKDLIALAGMGSRPFRVKLGSYNGKPQIRRIFSSGGLAIPKDARMSDAQKKALADRVMGGKSTPTKKSTPAPKTDKDDDLPF